MARQARTGLCESVQHHMNQYQPEDVFRDWSSLVNPRQTKRSRFKNRGIQKLLFGIKKNINTLGDTMENSRNARAVFRVVNSAQNAHEASCYSNVFSMGLLGLRLRLREHSAHGAQTEPQKPHWKSTGIAWGLVSILRTVDNPKHGHDFSRTRNVTQASQVEYTRKWGPVLGCPQFIKRW